jgi:hypothetical protein
MPKFKTFGDFKVIKIMETKVVRILNTWALSFGYRYVGTNQICYVRIHDIVDENDQIEIPCNKAKSHLGPF